jgi:hypothetical protein
MEFRLHDGSWAEPMRRAHVDLRKLGTVNCEERSDQAIQELCSLPWIASSPLRVSSQ